MTLSRRAFVGSLPLFVANAAAPARAQPAGWPSRPIHFIISPAPGSAGDDICRLVGGRLTDKFGYQFVMDDRPAAGGTLGVADLSRSPPDGYTIGLMSESTQVIAKLYNPDLPYYGVKNFALISLLGRSPYVLAVNPAVPAKSVAELVALAKAVQSPLRSAVFGTTSLGYLASALFARQAGIKLNHIPYRSSAQAVIDVVAGRVEMQFSTLPPAVPLIRAGKLRALATTGARRFATLPDVPTLAESGFPGFDVALWLAMAAPPGTSPDLIAKLNGELAGILGAADMRAAMLRQSFIAESSSPEALAREIAADLEKWRPIVASVLSQTP